jgi:hypothetical protein
VTCGAAEAAPLKAKETRRGLVVVVVHVVVIAAAAPYFLKFMTALLGLFAVLAMFFYSVSQLLFCSVNITVALVFRQRGQG